MKSDFNFIKDESERQFIKTVSFYLQKSDLQCRPFFTDFYNVEWMKSLLSRYMAGIPEDSYYFYGGYEGAERQVMCICPYPVEKNDCSISAVKVLVKTGPGRELTHRDYLGAVLGLGIDRKLIGDIILKPFGAYIILKSNIVPYVNSQLISVGKYHKLTIEEIDFELMQVEKPKTKVFGSTVMSLRADAVASACFKISRSECVRLIQSEKLKNNGIIAGVTAQIKEGDVLSLRGYGKAKLLSINGQTKKERLHITIEKYV